MRYAFYWSGSTRHLQGCQQGEPLHADPVEVLRFFLHFTACHPEPCIWLAHADPTLPE